MKNGCTGKVLWVDLTAGTFRDEAIPDDLYENYLGGVGLGVRLLYDRIPAGADPLGPENILGLTAGFLGGTGAWFMGRWMAMAKSPLTGGWGDANCGGTFAPAIKRAGYDALFFTGTSPRPVVLRIVDGVREIVDAGDLWGMDAIEAERRLRETADDPRTKVVTIGPAAEKLSLISGIVNDGGRIAARSGLGAVMGSKRLKAVTIAASGPVRIAEPARMKELSRAFVTWLDKGQGPTGKILSAKMMSRMGKFLRVSPIAVAASGDMAKVVQGKFGTIVTNVMSSENGDSPVKNWKGAGTRDFPIPTHAENLNPQRIIDREFRKYHCYSCPLGCGGLIAVKDGRFPIEEMHKPEYETCCSFGTLLLNRDMDAIYKINDVLNRAGMDTISAGGTVAFAIECVEQGVLSREDVDGLDLRWGNADAILALVEKMVRREGIGDLLADGVKVAAQKIGKGAERFAIHAGGQELPMHDSRFDPGFAVSYALEPTPGRHTNHGYQWLDLFAMHRLIPGLPKTKPLSMVKNKYDPEGKWVLQVAASKYMQLYNAAGGCLFGAQMGGNLPIFEYLNAATGWRRTPHNYLRVGERIQALRQAFNLKHGIVPPRDFAMPRRAIGEPPLDAGPMKGVRIQEERLQRDFLVGMGWDPETAMPTRAKLDELGLAAVAEELGAR